VDGCGSEQASVKKKKKNRKRRKEKKRKKNVQVVIGEEGVDATLI
jgi:hypothetical protein